MGPANGSPQKSKGQHPPSCLYYAKMGGPFLMSLLIFANQVVG